MRVYVMFGAGVIILGVVVTAGLLRSPAFASVSPNAPVLVAAGATADGRRLQPFTAKYTRWTRVAGLRVPVGPLRPRPGGLDVALDPESPGELLATITLVNAGDTIEDRIRLDAATLRPLRRQFTNPANNTFDLTFDAPTRLTGTITTPEGDIVRRLAFTFDAPVFEISLLELAFAASPLEPGSGVRLAWDNMVDPDLGWAEVRVDRRERLRAANGETYDTRVVRTRLPDGRLRVFWIADRPPYKIRMVQYERGRLITTGWDLKQVDTNEGTS